jgi:hypothetical protein
MNQSPKTLEQKFNIAAKWVAASFYLSFILFAVLSLGITYLETKWEGFTGWRWIFEAIAGALLRYTFLALTVSLLIPGPLILIFPALGYAWLRGFNRSLYSYKPWREVPDGEAFLHLLGAMFSFFVGMMILHQLVINEVFGQALASFVAEKLMAIELWLRQP